MKSGVFAYFLGFYSKALNAADWGEKGTRRKLCFDAIWPENFNPFIY